jgi:hypothetical protein
MEIDYIPLDSTEMQLVDAILAYADLPPMGADCVEGRKFNKLCARLQDEFGWKDEDIDLLL